jgi:hypothetical protein
MIPREGLKMKRKSDLRGSRRVSCPKTAHVGQEPGGRTGRERYGGACSPRGQTFGFPTRRRIIRTGAGHGRAKTEGGAGGATMAKQIFVNLPVKDLERAKAFFSALGFSFDPQFTDENAACLILGENLYSMLLVERFFRTFTHKELADTARTTEVITALAETSRERVDELAGKALASGGTPSKEPYDFGWMYGRSFQDPDGHLWEVFWMDPAGPPKS